MKFEGADRSVRFIYIYDVIIQRYCASVMRTAGKPPMCTFELPLGTMEVGEINLAPYPMPALDAVSREHQIPYTLQKDDGGKTGIVRI